MTSKTLYRIDFDEKRTGIYLAHEFVEVIGGRGGIPLDFAITCARKLYGDRFTIIEK